MLQDILIPLAALTISVVAALWFYDPNASNKASAAFGVIRNVGMAFAGAMLIISNTAAGIFLGGLLVSAAVFFAKGHWERMGVDVRAKING